MISSFYLGLGQSLGLQRLLRRQRERQKVMVLLSKTTTLHAQHAFCTFLCRRCTTTTWKCLNKRRRNFLSLSKRLECGPQEINSREILLLLTFSVKWKIATNFWKNANSFYKWRFLFRCRRQCLKLQGGEGRGALLGSLQKCKKRKLITWTISPVSSEVRFTVAIIMTIGIYASCILVTIMAAVAAFINFYVHEAQGKEQEIVNLMAFLDEFLRPVWIKGTLYLDTGDHFLCILFDSCS